MSHAWFFTLAGLVNGVSIVVFVLAVRERRRIEDARRRLRLVEWLADTRQHTLVRRPADVIHVPFQRAEP